MLLYFSAKFSGTDQYRKICQRPYQNKVSNMINITYKFVLSRDGQSDHKVVQAMGMVQAGNFIECYYTFWS